MSETIEIMDADDVEDIVREWVSSNIHEYTPSEHEIESIVEGQIESEINYGQIDTMRCDILGEVEQIEHRMDQLESGGADWKHLEERVADLERTNAKLLDTLGQFAQLLQLRDLI